MLTAGRSRWRSKRLEPLWTMRASDRTTSTLSSGPVPGLNRTSYRADAASPQSPPDVLAGFRYASAWLQQQLDLRNADVMAVAQQGCSTMFSAVRLARTLLIAEPERCHHVLCVGVDVLPTGAPREILYNVISDGACAVIVSRGCPSDVWLGYRQISRGYYGDPACADRRSSPRTFRSPRPSSSRCSCEQGLRPDQVDVVIPTGVSHASWDDPPAVDGCTRAIGCYRGVPSFGHTMTSDSFVFLSALRRAAHVPRGSRLLLFTYGFGSSWCGLLLEH